MNLQQLNQSGHNVWSFIVTASVSLSVIALIWFSLDQYTSVVDWKRKPDERVSRKRDPGLRLGIGVRIAMYFGLIDV